MLALDLLSPLNLSTKQVDGKVKVLDIVRKKWVHFSPEEHVRQALLHYLIHSAQYPKMLFSVEKQTKIGALTKRYDAVVYDRAQKPWMLIECKSPDIEISQATLYQLIQYHSELQCPYWLISNGRSHFCARVEATQIVWLDQLPLFQ